MPNFSLYVLFAIFFLVLKPYAFSMNFGSIAESGNYTCDELVRWLGTEKHYSNQKKEVLFGLLAQKDCSKNPVVVLDNVSFGWSKISNKRTFFYNPKKEGMKCATHDEFAIAYLSNFSINNNFSHFLHGLLRLFCALIDARVIVWSPENNKFVQTGNFTIWLDEYFKLNNDKKIWLESFGGTLRTLGTVAGKGECISSSKLIYGSGCVRLLPPEKWFGYPGCRAGEILPAFGHFMRQKHMALGAEELKLIDQHITPGSNLGSVDSTGKLIGQSSVVSSALVVSPSLERQHIDPGLRVAYAVRDVSAVTGMRAISNLDQVQSLIRRTQHVRSSMENVTFEHLDVPSTIRYMAGVHIFVSVHGAGMTNMFFMNSGAAVVEIIPYPLCNCRSPDYFYGVGGYYHGSAIAQGIKHYPYCVPAHEVKWHSKPDDLRPGSKCNWKHLHSVESIYVDPTRFVSLMRNVERDLVASGTILLTKPIINVSPHANG